jgi:hypothetical protein
VHEPLIGKAVFERAQRVLRGKTNTQNQRHTFLFRRMLSCGNCRYSLIGERQKGHIYYRCHSKQCSGTTIRETTVQSAVKQLLQSFRFTEGEKNYLKTRIEQLLRLAQ